MTDDLNADELHGLQSLSTDEPVKPDLPEPIGRKLIELGYAISLVEGGLQLTDLGRDRLTQES